MLPYADKVDGGRICFLLDLFFIVGIGRVLAVLSKSSLQTSF
jgi:hypothetical protein